MAVQKIHTIRGYTEASPGVIYTCPTGRVARIRINAHFVDFKFTINDNDDENSWLYNNSNNSLSVAGGRYSYAIATPTDLTPHGALIKAEGNNVNSTRNPGINAEFLTLSAGENLQLREQGSGWCNYHLEIIEEDNI